jgi:hypothetical protein
LVLGMPTQAAISNLDDYLDRIPSPSRATRHRRSEAAHPVAHADFYCPFPAELNPHVEAAHQSSLVWLRRFHLVHADSLRKVEYGRFAWLAARVHPRASLEVLRLVTRWFTWLFIHDDRCDAGAMSHSQLERLHTRYVAVLEGDNSMLSDGPDVHALADIARDIRSLGDAECVFRHARMTELYLAGVRAEAIERAKGASPRLRQYILTRRHTSAVYPCLELIDLTEGINLPAAVRDDDAVSLLGDIANDVVSWSNDILSRAKELDDRGDTYDLLSVLACDRGLSAAEAQREAIALHNNRVAEFVARTAALPSLGPVIDGELRRYIAGLGAWMRGNLDWSFSSGRYGHAPSFQKAG